MGPTSHRIRPTEARIKALMTGSRAWHLGTRWRGGVKPEKEGKEGREERGKGGARCRFVQNMTIFNLYANLVVRKLNGLRNKGLVAICYYTL
jgi:hypothetical protein